jgi:hypothetical protein
MTNPTEVLKAAREIPQDILDTAYLVYNTYIPMNGGVQAVALAILNERERCADIATREGRGFKDEGLPHPALGCFHVRRAILEVQP